MHLGAPLWIGILDGISQPDQDPGGVPHTLAPDITDSGLYILCQCQSHVSLSLDLPWTCWKDSSLGRPQEAMKRPFEDPWSLAPSHMEILRPWQHTVSNGVEWNPPLWMEVDLSTWGQPYLKLKSDSQWNPLWFLTVILQHLNIFTSPHEVL